MRVTNIYTVEGLSKEELDIIETTTVFESKDSPTGFVVSFRIKAPDIEWLGVIGDWMFSDRFHSSRYTSGHYWPHQWKSNLFPHMLLGLIEKPEILENASSRKTDSMQFKFDHDILKLGLYEMEKDLSTGIFSCTFPLPSGVFNYRFVLEIPNSNPQFMRTIPDPNHLGTYYGYKQKFSQVCVPYNKKLQQIDRSIELTNINVKKGKVIFEQYLIKGAEVVGDEQPLCIYLPPEYDQYQDKTYPVLYLSHGGGGNECDWFNQGALENILNNLIHQKKVEPMIVVTMNNENYKWNNIEQCIPNLVEYIIPFIEDKYRGADDPERRAFAGVSAGGLLAFELFSAYPEKFRFFGVWSGGQRGAVDFSKKNYQYPIMHIGAGRYDDAAYDFSFKLEDTCYKQKIRFTSFFPEGGHQWSVWRQLVEDFVDRVLWKTDY